jgi:DNA repair exonuclease SbcCD ATPase subunit
MRKRVSELNLLYGSEKQNLERLEEAADSLPEYTDEAERLRGELAVYEEKRNTAESAKEFLKRASYNLSSRYLRKMEQSFKENYEKASDSAMPTPNIDAELGLSFRDGGAERGTEWYSEGIRSLINLCMRLALTDALFENEAPFLVLDDPFSELD